MRASGREARAGSGVSRPVCSWLVPSVLLLSAGSAAADVLTREVLGNAEYASPWTHSARVRLRDGHSREPAAPGSATEIQVRLLDRMVRWRMDDRHYAAVILATEPGGSGTFYELVVLEAREGRPVQVASAELGDRVRVRSLSVELGRGPATIRLDLVVHGPADPLCCPTRLAVRSFVWRDGVLAPAE